MASQINASLMHAHNENTMALANVTLDFSLFKIQPPVEFTGLGSCLSEQRRSMAEDGLPHQTARKLGALFEQMIPLTPLLIKAYGCRASEISKSAAANSASGRKDGVFLQHAGADATSLWAAATSGSAAISAHLLACMLARTWSGPEAVAIWVEIVAERIRMILSGAEHDAFNTPMGALFAARTGISRKELSDWDASARAWLQIADDARQLQQKQLLLIIKNVALAVNDMESTFSSVTEAWSTAMMAVEKLLSGQPQSVWKGAVLLGLASWSLYPDLLVLAEAPTPVRFKDDLFSTGGTLTIGLENSDHSDGDGVYWSLALSNLRYYGDPVVVRTSVASQASRISLEELHLICLGSILAGWGEDSTDIIAAAEFFVALWENIQRATIDLQNPDHFAASESSWLFILVSASQKIIASKGEELKSALSVVILGKRKAHRFLAELSQHPPPMFGLASLSILNILSEDPKSTCPSSVITLRSIAEQLALAPEDCLIRIVTANPSGHSTHNDFTDFTTALPHEKCFEYAKKSHRWWVERLDRSSANGRFNGPRTRCYCHSYDGSACNNNKCPCFDAGLDCCSACHDEVHSQGQVDMLQPSTNTCLQAESGFRCQNEDKGCDCHGAQTSCNRERCSCIGRGMTCTLRCHNLSTAHGCGTNCAPFCPAKERLQGATAFLCDTMRSEEVLDVLMEGFELIFEAKAYRQGASSEHRKSQAHMLNNQRNATFCSLLCNDSSDQRSHFSKMPALLIAESENATLVIRANGPVEEVHRRVNYLNTSILLAKNKPWLGVKAVIEKLQTRISPQLLLEYLSTINIKSDIVLPQFGGSVKMGTYACHNYMRSLDALTLVTKAYGDLGRATISVGIISRPLHQSLWIPPYLDSLRDPKERYLARKNLFCCIAMLDSGHHDLSPNDFEDVMAISVRNTIYISKTLLGDPYDLSNQHKIALFIGNVGQSGMVLMVAPQAPRVRKPNLDHWREVAHAVFTGELDDYFKATSLHLSFTEFSIPLTAARETRGAIDSDLKMVETLISAHDRGKWVGDLDVLAIYKDNSTLLQRFQPVNACTHDKTASYPHRLTSLDNWEEILDAPEDFGHENAGVVRASNNWLARIATACISVQLGHKTVVLPSEVTCWHCCCENNWIWSATRKHRRPQTTHDSDDEEAATPFALTPTYPEGYDGELLRGLDPHAILSALASRSKRHEIFVC